MSEPLQGVVVAHAGLARALVEAVDRIVGLEDGALVAVSNEGLGPAEIRSRIAAAMGPGPGVLFTDLREGSCGLAARQACVDRPEHVLVTGVNLPMLLDFAVNRHRPLEEVVARALDRGRGSIQSAPDRS